MFQISNLTDASDQITALVMPDGSTGTLELIYGGSISQWYFNFTHPQFPNGAVQGQILCQHPNILRNWKNVIDFGMSCVSLNGVDPVNLEDFADGNISLYILAAADVQYVEENIYLSFV